MKNINAPCRFTWRSTTRRMRACLRYCCGTSWLQMSKIIHQPLSPETTALSKPNPVLDLFGWHIQVGHDGVACGLRHPNGSAHWVRASGLQDVDAMEYVALCRCDDKCWRQRVVWIKCSILAIVRLFPRSLPSYQARRSMLRPGARKAQLHRRAHFQSGAHRAHYASWRGLDASMRATFTIVGWFCICDCAPHLAMYVY